MVNVRMRDEDGAVTIIVAVFITVLFGFVALAVDVARMYEEKAQLESATDLSALAGAQLLWKGKADAEAAGETYVTENPSVNHPGAYNELTGDLVEAKRTQEGTGCRADVSGTGSVTLDPDGTIATSQLYDCVESTVQSPFEFLFASVLGFGDRTITNTSTSFMGNGAPRGTQIVPWILRDCPNGGQYPDEAGVATPSGCPYEFTDSFVDDPNSPLVTQFEESGLFVGGSLAYEAIGCPLPSGFKNVFHDNNTYMALNRGDAAYVPCRVAPGQRVLTRGGSLGAQLKTALEGRGATTAACANEAAFNSALSRTGDGDGFVTIVNRNPCLVQVAFAVRAAPASRVPDVDDDVAGTPTGMQAQVNEPGFPNASRFSSLGNNQAIVIRRLAWYYITGYTSGSQSAPIGVYLRAVDNDNSILNGPMDVCPVGVPISECAQHGIYIVKLVN